jgi:ATP-dependent Clp protease ATP-binding subunit ClpC
VALAIARAIAAARGDADVTPTHIALGLIREGENAAVAVLEHRGVALRSLRRELERLLGPPPGGTEPEAVVLPLTQGERDVLAAAGAWSRREGDEHVGPEHLLLAILADGATHTAQTLARHGIGTESATASMRVVIHKHPNTPPPASPPRAV